MDPDEDERPDPPAVRLDRVDKRYARGTLALSGLSLAIRQCEFVSLLGPSGCGKSTVLRLIAGLTPPSAGTVTAASIAPLSCAHDAPHAPAAEPAARSAGVAVDRIGFVFQEPTLMPWASVADNVALPLRLQRCGREQARARVDEVLALVGLSGFAHAYPRELSGGMRMRVSLARAMITRPRLLLLDEPFAALDEITRARLNDDLLALWASHRLTVVFVTHSVYESVYLSNRVVVMSARPGRVHADLRIDAPAPRNELYRTSAEYGRQCRQVSEALRDAQHAEPARA
ncbi:MAG: ABC transporter ATP-binding protein [Burkholderiaceae bacterium]